MKVLAYVFAIFFIIISCAKEDINSPTNTITTFGHGFEPETLYCNLGDILVEMWSSMARCGRKWGFKISPERLSEIELRLSDLEDIERMHGQLKADIGEDAGRHHSIGEGCRS